MEANASLTHVILFAHGSRVEQANEGVRALAARVQSSDGNARITTAFLELAKPNLRTAIAEAAEAGAARIVVVPYFLTMGVHLRCDLPALLDREREARPGIEFIVAESLEGHPAMPSLVADRIRAAI